MIIVRGIRKEREKNCQFYKKDDEETEEENEVYRNLTYSSIQLRRRDKAMKAFEFL